MQKMPGRELGDLQSSHPERREGQGILAERTAPLEIGVCVRGQSLECHSRGEALVKRGRSLNEGLAREVPRPTSNRQLPCGFQPSLPSTCPTFPLSHPEIWGILPSSTLSPSPGTWRPRRSIVFASWGAEEFGLIGSTEFTEVSEPRSRALQGIPGAGRAGLTRSRPPAGVLQQAAGACRGLHQRGHLGVWYEGLRG